MKDTISLHDSRVREINLANSSLELMLGDFEGKLKFSLRYSGLKSFRSTANPSIGLSGPHGYGDLGYDEIYVEEDGLFLHCILFSSGIEFQILFSQFDFDLQDSPKLFA